MKMTNPNPSGPSMQDLEARYDHYTVSDARGHIARCVAAQHSIGKVEHLRRAYVLATWSQGLYSNRFWPLLPRNYKAWLAMDQSPDAFEPLFVGRSRAAKQYITACDLDTLAAEIETMTDAEMHTRLTLGKDAKGLLAAKAGFVVQLMRGTLGCMDSVNRRWFFGSDHEALESYDKAVSSKAKSGKGPAFYRAFLASQEDTESAKLWHGWCIRVAHEQGICPKALSESHATWMESCETLDLSV